MFKLQFDFYRIKINLCNKSMLIVDFRRNEEARMDIIGR